MKICIIGVRGHHHYVFDEIGQLPQVELVGISSGGSDDIGVLADHCDKVGVSPAVYNDYRLMLDELKPDAVAINGPFNLHAQMSIDALERGIHVLCEKPVALNLDDLARLEAAYAETDGLIFFSMVGLRYEPAFLTAWKAVQDGAVGQVKLIHAQKSYKLGERPDFYRSRETYGGTIPWVGSHALDWIYWFSGSDFKSVAASHTVSGNFGHGELEVAATCQFLMQNGVQASASIDYLRPAAAPTHGDDRVRVAGTEGVIEVLGGRVMRVDFDGERELPVDGSYGAIFKDFVGAVDGTCEPLTNAAETFSLTRACLLARESADTGRAVEFE